MNEKFLKLSNLFKEQKYNELIFFIETSFPNKSAQILNLLGVARLLNNRAKKKYKLLITKKVSISKLFKLINLKIYLL